MGNDLVIHNGPNQIQMVAIVKRLIDMQRSDEEAPTIDFVTSDGPISATVYSVSASNTETIYHLALGIKNCSFAEARYSSLTKKGILQMSLT